MQQGDHWLSTSKGSGCSQSWGCDLPGLYARALQLGPGVPPDHGVLRVADERRRCLLYRDVDRDAADLLITLLTT